MQRIRVIPVLLLHKGGLIKSVKFKNYQYIGDPINAVRIFNEKEVDEIVVLDVDASREKRKPNFDQIREIASEAFIPLAYGGGISEIEDIKKLFFLGIEKVVFNYQAINNISLITSSANLVGSQSIVVSIDVKKNWLGKYKVFTFNGNINTNEEPVTLAKKMENAGAGELILNSIDRDGTYQGYDIDLIQQVCTSVNIPVIVCGGAGSIDDFRLAIKEGKASAVAAGSYFVFQRPHNAVLISYPSPTELKEKLYNI